MRRPRWVALGAAGVLAAIAVGAPPAMASIITGKVTGVAIPAPGTGRAFVRAVSLETGEVVESDALDRAGRYRLGVPKGAFALFPAVITLHAVVAPKPTRARVRNGQRRAVPLPGRSHADVARPVVTFRDGAFSGATGEFSAMNMGLFQMLVTDLGETRVPDCDLTVVARDSFALSAIGAERALVRSGRADPATAIRLGRIVAPTVGIRGTVSVSGGRLRITAQVYRWRSGATVATTSVEGAVEEFFTLEPVLARKLAALACGKAPPVAGTFSGSLDYARVVPSVQTGSLTWSGSVELEADAAPLGIPPQFGGPSATYHLRSGTLTARLQVTSLADGCTLTGEQSFDILAITAGSGVPVLSVTDGSPETYRLALDGGTAAIPVTVSGCPAGGAGTWPLRGILLLPSSRTPAVAAPLTFAGSASGTTVGVDDGYAWTWGLRG